MKSIACLSLSLLFGFCTVLCAQDVKPAKILHFTRSQGYEHGPAKLQPDGTTISGQALKKYFADKNVEVVETQDGTVFDGDISQYDAFVFYTSGNLLDPNISQKERVNTDTSKPMTEAGLRKMIEAVRNGKGFVGIHSGTDTHCNIKENDKDIYVNFIGGRFAGHNDQQFATVSIVQPADFPFLKDSGTGITTWDEWYTVKDINKDMHVILIQETGEMFGKDYERPPYPASWIRAEGKGRVGYSCFGHDDKYFRNTANVRRIADMIEWSLGRFDADTTPNVENVTPKAFELPKK